jgi:hypothetical protein
MMIIGIQLNKIKLNHHFIHKKEEDAKNKKIISF